MCVLASGDPMFHGIGTTLVRLLGPDRVRVLPHPSSVSLACARLGWAVDGVEVVSLVDGRRPDLPACSHPGRRVLVLAPDAATPARWPGCWPRRLRRARDDRAGAARRPRGASRARHRAPAGRTPPGDPLNVVAVECGADPGRRSAGLPGLPDDAYEHDGQLTKREVRAVTLARLAPRPGELLWDVGAGSGQHRRSSGCGRHPTCRAVAVETRPGAGRADRAQRRGAGRARAAGGGRPAPDALAGCPTRTRSSSAAASRPRAWSSAAGRALRPGGRLVANAVTLESEAVLAAWHAGSAAT